MGISLQEVLTIPPFNKASVIAGLKGLNRTITSIGVMNTHKSTDCIRSNGLILLSGYDNNGFFDLCDLIQKANIKDATGIAIEFKRCIDDIDIKVVNLANELSLPIVCLPFKPDRVDYIDKIWSVIRNRDTEVGNSTKIVDCVTRGVLTGEGFDSILQTAGATLGTPCALFDIQGNLISYFGYHSEFWHEVNSHYLSGSPYAEICEGIYSCKTKESTLEFFQIISQIKTGNDHFGNLFVLSQYTFTNYELIILMQVLTVCCLEFQRNKTLNTLQRYYRESFLNDLILGLVVDPTIIKEKLDFYGVRLEGGGTVVIIDFSEKSKKADSIHLLVSTYRSLLDNYLTDNNIMSTFLADQFVIIIPFKDKVIKIVSCVAEILENNEPTRNHKIAIGRDTSDISKIHLSYNDARNLLKLEKFSNESILDYKKLGLVRLLLDKIDQESLKEFFQEYLDPILDYELENHINLLDTLEAYYQEDCNIRNTGKRLFIHFNTVRYRLNLLKDITKLDIDDPDVKATLTIALKIRSLI